MVQVGGLVLLPNVLLVVVELRVFIAYMSVFHVINMFMFLLVDSGRVVTFTINYLSMYMLVIIFFFFYFISG